MLQQVCPLSTTNGPENKLAKNAITVYTVLQSRPPEGDTILNLVLRNTPHSWLDCVSE